MIHKCLHFNYFTLPTRLHVYILYALLDFFFLAPILLCSTNLTRWSSHLPIKNDSGKRHIAFKVAKSPRLVGKCVVLHIDRIMAVNTIDNPSLPGLQTAEPGLTPHSDCRGIITNCLPSNSLLSLPQLSSSGV